MLYLNSTGSAQQGTAFLISTVTEQLGHEWLKTHGHRQVDHFAGRDAFLHIQQVVNEQAHALNLRKFPQSPEFIAKDDGKIFAGRLRSMWNREREIFKNTNTFSLTAADIGRMLETLAETRGLPREVLEAEDLIEAHSKTIQWNLLEPREIARTGEEILNQHKTAEIKQIEKDYNEGRLSAVRGVMQEIITERFGAASNHNLPLAP